jgi:hypothetical protein
MPVFGSSQRFRPKTKLKRFGGDLGGLLTDLLEGAHRRNLSASGHARCSAASSRRSSLLRYSHEENIGRRVQLQRDRAESLYELAPWDILCQSREFRTGDYEEIMNKASCLRLVSNAFSMNTPERTTAAALPRYFRGKILADSTSIQWSGLYVRRIRNAPVVDRLLVPATPEPSISCAFAGWTLNGRGLTSDWL